ncbi:hypothetical protein [Mycolicibacterium grossiae]|uniref:Uncharacterized protein n=1 Tax=Mycolicibacterium grossiae TaxID=1552759 RepID=A0A1E8Q5W7_9MYCO|nr:hypothetical protein [Mycolicibacterium grossiae]OFJ53641.1 hypothetical protein BEL07_11270 [Mycolicibacterium grossiae]QEM46768.1 hypothetical protein FZ046_20135 [Mycolicibacterium grossiae]
MKYTLEVDLPETEDAHVELGRMLRQWGDEITELGELVPGDKQDVYDAEYNRVGSWSVQAVTE